MQWYCVYKMVTGRHQWIPLRLGSDLNTARSDTVGNRTRSSHASRAASIILWRGDACCDNAEDLLTASAKRGICGVRMRHPSVGLS